jgi:transcription initiation factor TFIID TATA-box-binding protein
MEVEGEEFLGMNEDLNEKTLRQYAQLADGITTESEAAPGVEPCPLTPFIVNIVVRVNYGTTLDLLKIATHTRNAEYNPKRFPAVTLRIQEPKATGLTFKTGIMNIVGCRTEESAHLAARKFGRILKNLGFSVRLKTFSVVNIVATMDCRFPIHLESLARSTHRLFTQYNPEVFAGLIYSFKSMRNPGERNKCTFLVFVSGKMVVTGAENMEIIYEGINYIHPILQQFARDCLPDDSLPRGDG